METGLTNEKEEEMEEEEGEEEEETFDLRRKHARRGQTGITTLLPSKHGSRQGMRVEDDR